MTDYLFHISVHVYEEERLKDDFYLDPNNPDYGIIGDEILEPLRKVNGKTLCVKQVLDTFSVKDLWSWLEWTLYSEVQSIYTKNVLQFVQESQILQKYLCFNGLRYTVQDSVLEIPLINFLQIKQFPVSDPIEIQILVSGNAGDLCRDDGIRYYMPSKEESPHNEPHVHVDIKHEESGTFSLITGKQLQKEEKVKAKYARKIKNKIVKHRKEWLEYWNEHTDGLDVDLNQAFGLIEY